MELKEFYDTFNNLRKSILNTKTESERKSNEEQQEEVALKIEKWFIDHPDKSPYRAMPYQTDQQFNAKISEQAKFNVWNQSPDATHDKDQFIRTDSQNFVKTFIHPNSPYHSIILWHGTGVGKTCSAIGIAEQYTEQIFSMNKKVWIVCPKALISTWYNEIFNVFTAVAAQVKSGTSLQSRSKIVQCTGHRYTSIFETLMKELDGDIQKVQKRIQTHIEKYYRIINYEKFVQVVEDIRNNTASAFEGDMIRQLKREFSHAMIIIDEAHSLRKTRGDTTNRSVNALRSIRSVKVPRGTVISLSNRRGLRKGEFSKNIHKNATAIRLGTKGNGGMRIDRISGNGTVILYEKTKYQGRSIVIAPNIETFTIKKVTKTITDVLQYITRHSDQLKLILLSATPVYDSHEEIVDLVNMCRLNDKRPMWSRPQIFPSDLSLKDTSHPLYNFTKGYVSYVRGADPKTFPTVIYPPTSQTKALSTLRVYPSLLTDIQAQRLEEKKNVSDIDPSKKMISTLMFPNGGYDNQAFHALFTSRTNAPPFTQPNGKSMFSKTTLSAYSPKYKNVLREIQRCKGIVFVYTEYLVTGAFTIAMMLEENGFHRYSSASFPRPAMLQNISAAGQRVPKQGSYVIFDQSNPVEISELLQAINSPKNKRGKDVRVIIGTRRIEQGITFKHVRQIHILTPWWNMNRNKQIIGRGSRTLSHANLPQREQNVTVFFHVGIGKNKTHSPDVHTYERALEKQRLIQEVEDVLRKNSIDCNTFSHNNQYTRKAMSIIDSHGRKRTVEAVDIVTEDVNYMCVHKADGTQPFIMSAELIPKVKQLYRIVKKTLFPSKQYVLSKEHMVRRMTNVCNTNRIPLKLIPFTLHHIIHSDLPIYSGNGEGRLSFVDGYYTFIPLWMSTGDLRYVPLIYRTIAPPNPNVYSNGLRGLRSIMAQEINENVTQLSIALKGVSNHIISQYSNDVYTKKHIKLFTMHRQMMLIDEMDTVDRIELFHQWRGEKLDEPTHKIVSGYFGTAEEPSFVDKHVSKVVLNGSQYFRLMGSNGSFEIFKNKEKVALSNRASQIIRASFPVDPVFNLETVTAQYVGFRSYTRRGSKTVFKIVSEDSYSKHKNRKSGCTCKASGLGRKNVVVSLLSTLKTILTGKRSTQKYDKIHQSSKHVLKKRTVCEELELLFRTIKHKDVSFGSLRKYTSTSI